MGLRSFPGLFCRSWWLVGLLSALCGAQSTGEPSTGASATAARIKFERGLKASAFEHRLAAVRAFAERDGERVFNALDRALAGVRRDAAKLVRSARRVVKNRAAAAKRRRAIKRLGEERQLEAALIGALAGVCSRLDPREVRDPPERIERVVHDGLDATSLAVREAAVRAWTTLNRPDAYAILMHWLDVRLRAVRARRAGSVAADERGRDAIDPRLALRLDEGLVDALRPASGVLFDRSDATTRDASLRRLSQRFEHAADTQTRLETIETIGNLRCPESLTLLRAAAAAAEPEVRMVALEALGRHGGATVVLTLAKALEDPYWQVRVIAVDALERAGGRLAVDVLVDAISEAVGRLRSDMNRALTILTGEDFHENPVLWAKWWRANRHDYRGRPSLPSADAIAQARKRSWMNRTRGVAFYGIETSSKRIVYILDLSGSMNDRASRPKTEESDEEVAASPRKIDAAIAELERSITSLSADATFNIVFYNASVVSWRTEQIAATPENRAAAKRWARGVVAVGGTNLFGAIEHAFGLAGRTTMDARFAGSADTFFVLSDGQPTVGRLTGAKQIVEEVRRMNRFRGVRIHTVAVGATSDAAFMRNLAAATGGSTAVIGR